MNREHFDLDEGRALLERTPGLLRAWLHDLPDAWQNADEGPDTWSPAVVLGHLVEGERNDWIPRVRHLLAHGETRAFPPFDRFSQLHAAPRSVEELLAEFAELRARSLADLAALNLSAADLERFGRHPEFGRVTLAQHLATWVLHDLDHVAQVARAMAFRWRAAIGPWRAYLRIARAKD